MKIVDKPIPANKKTEGIIMGPEPSIILSIIAILVIGLKYDTFSFIIGCAS